MFRRVGVGRVCAALLLAGLLLGAGLPTAAQEEPVSEEQIEEAIVKLRDLLYTMQDKKTGGWFGVNDKTPAFDEPHRDGGVSTLATLALISSGESPKINPDLAKAVDYVQSLQREHKDEVDGTYVIGIRAHIWPQLPREQYAASLERDAKRLLAGASKEGTFGYLLSKPPKRNPSKLNEPLRYDHSTTQYGVLGLWEAAKQGVRVPDSFWKSTAKHFVETQWPNGGWSYSADKEPTPSMACAGLTVLCVAQQQLSRDEKKPDPKLTAAIDRGLEYFDNLFLEGKSFGGNGYFIYSVERVGLATGRSRFAGKDWYDHLARVIIRRVNRPSDKVHEQTVNASFFLMFLSRGRVPVFINKLSLEGIQDWNNRPNDIYFLARHLSDTFEQELNWKVVPIDWGLERWLGAPLTYLSIDKPFKLTDEQAQTIKQYLDLGGLLIVNPEAGTSRILASVNKLADQMYPGRKLEPVDKDHAVLSLWRTPQKTAKLYALNNGVRDLILMPKTDWGLDWQRGGKNADDAYTVGGNLFLYATGYRRLDGRASVRYPTKPDHPKGPRVVVAVTGPGTAAEPKLWEYLKRSLGKAGTANLHVAYQPLEQLGQPVDVGGKKIKPDLVHLVGIEKTDDLGDAIAAIKAYADQGGTVLVETLGGRGGFASSVETQLAAALGAPAERLSRYEALFSAEGKKGAADISRVTYRTFSVRNYSTDNKPRLVAFRVGDRPAILVSGEDLSLAAMGVRHWELHGYSAESSRQLLSNIALHAKK